MAEQPDGFGRPVSGGIAIGQAYCPPSDPDNSVEVPFHDDQRMRLEQARTVARFGLEELASRHEDDSADILEFQIEILDDPSLASAMEHHLEAGFSVYAAWNAAFLDVYNAFSMSDDPDLQARAVDVADVKNRGLRALGGITQSDFPAGSIFVASDMEPSAFLSHDWTKGGGILLREGSDASHVAILARARSVPMIVKCGTANIAAGAFLKMDGQTGSFTRVSETTEPSPVSVVQTWDTYHRLTSVNRAIEFRLFANISDPEEVVPHCLDGLDGIGLVRTEFLVRSDLDLYDEARQVDLYRTIINVSDGKPVTFRLFDFGFDKPIAGTHARKDISPLGLRGVRLLFANPDILKTQVRALLEASRSGPVRILIPMVTVPSELSAVRSLFEAEFHALSVQYPDLKLPPIGMMVEVPAAALMLDQFWDADFYSFGTNDLAQYLAAADRHDSDVADIYAQARPSVLRLLDHAMDLIGKSKKPASICGDMAADAACLPQLIKIGFSDFSVALDRVAAVDALLAPRKDLAEAVA